jgi:hypothetical protein
MSLTLRLGLALLVIMSPHMAWGNGEQALDQLSQRWASSFSDQDSQRGKDRLSSPLYQASLTPTFFTLPMTSSRLKDLTPETYRARTQGLLASIAWMKGTLVTETEVANNVGGAGWLQGKIPGDTSNDASTRMVRLGLTGTAGTVRYGMMYRTAGQAFYNGPDQATREVWGEWKSGWTTLRSTFGQLWNNVGGDSTRSRMEQTYERVGLAWDRPAWPNITLTYAQNSLTSTLDPIGVVPQQTRNHTLEAALAYNSTNWNARLASSYILGSDLIRNGAENNVKMQVLTASFHPLNTLTIAPTLVYREEVQEWSGVRIDSPTASLALQYKQSPQLLINAAGNYSGTHSSDGLIDSEIIGGNGSLSLNVQQFRTCTTSISVEAKYNRLANHVTPSAGTEDISGLIRLVLAGL